MGTFVAASMTIALNISSYMSEIIRSFISAVEEGQFEVGLSVGMTNF
jgi:ABC-type amino acid transport system permease subunit